MEITNEESLAVTSRSGSKKQKDPKKVAAGKALAIKNAEARKNSKAPKKEEEDIPSLSLNDISENIKKVAGLVGAGFTLYYGWKFFYPEQNVTATRRRDVQSEKSVTPRSELKEPKSNMMGCMD